jgi:hypothetical protein
VPLGGRSAGDALPRSVAKTTYLCLSFPPPAHAQCRALHPWILLFCSMDRGTQESNPDATAMAGWRLHPDRLPSMPRRSAPHLAALGHGRSHRTPRVWINDDAPCPCRPFPISQGSAHAEPTWKGPSPTCSTRSIVIFLAHSMGIVPPCAFTGPTTSGNGSTARHFPMPIHSRLFPRLDFHA